jgi:hypothetical protein
LRFWLAIGIGLGATCAALIALGYVFRGPAVLRVPEDFERRDVSPERLRATVEVLCTELAPRWYRPAEDLERVADWVLARFQETGLAVSEQRFHLREGEYRNMIATRRGVQPERGVVIIGAHYDAYGGLPGADDNASGVAVLLELMRTLPRERPRQTQKFVAFANEEPPLFSTEDMGSYHYVRKLIDEGTSVDLMIALDLVGFFSDEPGSQGFPLPLLRLYYPSRGNFIGVVGDMGAGRWIERVKRGMRAGSRVPVLSFRGPRFVPGVDWSDHYWFREFGLPGVLISDTAMLRNPNYHRHTDTPDTLDYESMAEVVQGLHAVLAQE